MNFATEKMAKSLDLPSKAYMTELKKQKPGLFAKLQAEYDGGFQKFFQDISFRIKQMMAKEMDIKAFIEACQKEFQKRNEFEKQLSATRKIEVSSDDEPRIKKAKAVGEYVWSDDESPVPPSGTVDTRLVLLQAKYDALQQDFNNLNVRYSQCKSALAHELELNQKLRTENELFRKHCFCRMVVDLVQKRKRE